MNYSAMNYSAMNHSAMNAFLPTASGKPHV
jgi:hypothetical protein